jgi:hypothetical protein
LHQVLSSKAAANKGCSADISLMATLEFTILITKIMFFTNNRGTSVTGEVFISSDR